MRSSRRIGIRGATLLALSLAIAGCGSAGHPRVKESPIGPGEIETWAGTGTQGSNGDGKGRLETWLNQPMELAFSPDGSALLVDWNNHCVRRVTEDVVESVIGLDMPGDWPCVDPAEPTRCQVPLSGTVPGDQLALNHPMDVAFDEGGFLLAAWHDHKVMRYDDGTGDVSVLSGLMEPGPAVAPPPADGSAPPPNPPGDGGPAAKAPLNFPSSIVIQPDGGILVSDERNNRIRRIAPDGPRTITTVAGAAPAAGTDADGVPATKALLSLTTSEVVSGADNPPPGGAIALADDGTLYVADTFHHAVRRIQPGADGLVGVGDPAEELISTVAGTRGVNGYDGDGGPATAASLNQPFDVELGPDGALYVADTKNHVVRRVDLESGTIETIAGTNAPGFSGDRGPAKEARLRDPYGLAFDAAGDLFIADTMNDRIRRVAR
ncbi:MAG TPA: hypothetical protein VHE30_15640 [Polyangiaceae bacterium]|nr:hypothetical protein [Polyangiaceae bacterium]